MNAKTHWDHVYETKAPDQVSWYQPRPTLSLEFIRRAGVDPDGRIIDVGGGASTLVDDLLAAGFRNVTVLDISGRALEPARRRLGPQAAAVTWIEADVLQAGLPARAYDLWHDRAVFHFLTDPLDRLRYVEQARRAVRPGGYVIVACFAPDGPERCSGLEVARYSPEGLQAQFGESFALVDSARETHHTPFGTEQKFVYGMCRLD